MTATTTEPTLADLSAQLDRLTAQVDALADCNRQRDLARQPWTDLTADVAPVATAAFGRVVTELEERRDYFPFAKAGVGVMDRVVASFTEEDVEQLGENIVLILHTVKEMTQPEVMRLLQRTARVVREDATTETPSIRRLLHEMRDPAVKRGMHRLLTVLRSLSEEDQQITNNGRRP